MTPGAVALITGAGRGIGRAIALRLAKDGYNIALNDIRQSDGLQDTRKEIKNMGREVIECIADVSKEVQVKGMVDVAVKDLGGLDVMVANAGLCVTKPFMQSTLEDWDKSFDLNGKGVFLCYKYAAKRMIEQGRGGRIIGACSQAGKQGHDLLAIYCATKSTVRSLTQSAAMALKPHNITVNAYAPDGYSAIIPPGFVDTLLVSKIKEDLKNFVDTPVFDAYEIGKPEQVAALVSYLVSKEAQFVTGQSVNINGGGFFE